MSGDASALAEGMKRMQASDLQGARAMFQEAILTNPSNGQAHGYLGIVKTRLGDPQGGLLDLQQAVRLQPNDAAALYNLAVALAQVNRTEDARGALQHALTLDPTNAKARAALDKLGATAVVSQPQQPAYASPQSAYSPPPPAGASGAMPLAGAMPLTGPQPLTGAQPLSGPMPLTGQPMPPSSYSTPPSSYGVPPSSYGSPAPAYGGAPSVYGGPGRPGTTYSPPMGRGYSAPSTGTRIGRGIGWGALLGQTWTIYIGVWLMVLWGMLSALGGSGGIIGLGIGVVLFIIALGNAVVFGLAGLIIGAADLDDEAGAIVGIVASLLIVGAQYLLGFRAGFMSIIFGVMFAVSFGRGVGAAIANKCQA
jgi:hypothetical protein